MTTFEIKELTGDQRTVRLSGRALPYRPFKLEGEHKIEETSYAGFATKTQQAIGAVENETQIQGCWKERYISGERSIDLGVNVAEVIDGTELIYIDSSAVNTPREACELFDDIRRKGQQVQVTWLHISRIGRLRVFRQSWDTEQDVNWEMVFAWSGRAEGAESPSPAQPDIAEVARQTSGAYVDLQDAIGFNALGDDLDPNFADSIDIRTARIQQSVLGVEDAIRARTDAVTNGADATRRALSTLTFVQNESSGLIEELDATVAASMVIAEDPSDLTDIPTGAAIAAACAQRAAVRAARRLLHRAGRQRVRTARATEAQVLAVVMIRQEQDLRDLAVIFYGNADDWQLIRAFNNLQGSIVGIGQVVMIPVRGGA